MFKKMFPGVEVVEINLANEILTTLKDGARTDVPLVVKEVDSHVNLLKDYLNIKENITNVIINLSKKEVHVFHTNGSKKL